MGQINLSARIWGTNWVDSQKDYLSFGLYQHFDYYDSDIISDASNHIPYRFGAPASFGAGLMHENKRYGKWNLSSCFHLNALILGASLSDHYSADDRNYNWGDGFGIQAGIAAGYNRKIELSLQYKSFYMFTLKGYPEGFDLKNADENELDFQGDKSNTDMNTWALQLDVKLAKNLRLTVEYQTFSRFTRYRFFEDVRSRSSENLIMLGYMF